MEMREVPEPLIIALLNETVGPRIETVADRPVVPVKPFKLVRVSIEALEEPILIVKDDGLAEMLKSGGGTVTRTFVERDSVPFSPVTVTV